MTKKFTKKFSIRSLVLISLISSLLFSVAFTTHFIHFGSTSFQGGDGIYLALIFVFPTKIMVLVGVIYVVLFDLVSGSIAFIPCSIIIHLTMVLIIKLGQKWVSPYLLLSLASCLILVYVPYNYWMNQNLGKTIAQASALRELIVDAIQVATTVVVGLILTFTFHRPSLNSYLTRHLSQEKHTPT